MSKFSYKFDEDALHCEVFNGRIKKWYYGEFVLEEENNKSDSFNVNLFYNYYTPQQKERKIEIDYCLDALLKNKKIDNYYVFCSDDLNLEDTRLVKIDIDRQPKYKDFFNLINFFTKENDINIIINSDCYVDEISIDVIKNKLNHGESYVLTRWEISQLTPFKAAHFDDYYKDYSGCSQDCWVFKGKPKKNLNGNFEMGRAGCDNSIAHEFDQAGYIVSNPSLSVKVYHYHLSKIRTYGNFGRGYDDRENFRIPPPYKFVVSSGFISEGMNLVFYNHYHNGDIHYSREFIKDIIKKFKANKYYYYFDLDHVCSKDIIKDVKIDHLNKLPIEISEKDKIQTIGNTIYINTWIGQRDRFLVNKFGINLECNYNLYKEIYQELGIQIEDMEYYIPTIDFSYYDTSKIDKFLKEKNGSIKVLISNGITRSAQVENFDMNDAIDGISSLYKNITFILTDSSNRTDKKNVVYTDDIIGKKCDLNEISYLSKYCDIIVGRASGPYAFSQIKENLLNPKKYFICFADKPEYEWYISSDCKHVVSNKYRKIEIMSEISDAIDYITENKDKKIIRRIAFTIIFNGLHHLKHKDYANFIVNNFDYWIVVEGASKNFGSTRWCKSMPDKYHKNGKSIDGTVDYLKNLKSKHSNIIFIESNGIWNSKDDMVNRAIEEAGKLTKSCFLWEIDIDEQWTLDQIIKSERELKNKRAKTGKFKVFQFVGENLIAEGKDWAGIPFTRLWDWKGERFISHEPPILDTEDKSEAILSERMMHYAFYFEQDVTFKNDWYTDHDGLLENWKKLKTEKYFPQHITYLFPKFKDSSLLVNSSNLDCQIVKYKGDIEYNTINNLIDKAYCINLERRKDRKDHMQKEFKKININYEFFKAFDGKELKTKDIPVRKAIISTVKSHLGVIQDAIKNGYDTIAVFEDDIIFCDDFEERLKIYLRDVPTDWEILYLGCHFNSCEEPKKLKNNVFSVNECFGCFAMILNNKNGLFKKILDIKNDNKPYDNHIKENVLPKTNAYVFMPFFVKTLKTTSDISERTDSFSYDIVDKYFINKLESKKEPIIKSVQQTIVKPSPPPPPPPPPKPDYIKSNQEICEDFVNSNHPFQIYHYGRIIFDSDSIDKRNLYFFRDNFTLYGKTFSYQGMVIKRK